LTYVIQVSKLVSYMQWFQRAGKLKFLLDSFDLCNTGFKTG